MRNTPDSLANSLTKQDKNSVPFSLESFTFFRNVDNEIMHNNRMWCLSYTADCSQQQTQTL